MSSVEVASRPERQAMPVHTPAAERIFMTLLARGALSRVDLARDSGLSAAAVTQAVRPLLDAGYLREAPAVPRASGAGRPAIPIEVNAARATFIGLKVTADELIGVVTDLQANIRTSRRLAL